MNRLLLFCFLWITGGVLDAQSTYVLVYTKGDVKHFADQLWQPLSVSGASVLGGQVVKLGKGAEAIFTDEQQQIVYLKTEGVYQVKDFAKMTLKKSESSFAGHYLKYVAHELTHQEEDLATHYKEYLRNVGGVSRGRAHHCLLTPVNQTLLPRPLQQFSWINFSSPPYTISFYQDSLLLKKLFSETVRDTSFSVSVTDERLPDDVTIYWTVSARTAPVCETFSFLIPGPDAQTPFEEQHHQLLAQLVFPDDLNAVIEGQFYEMNGRLMEAARCYQTALHINPANTIASTRLRQIRDSD